MAATGAEEQLIEALRKRLHTSGPLPKVQHVTAAVALVREPSLKASKACNDAGVPKGGARSRVEEYRKRIVGESLLSVCAPSISLSADWIEAYSAAGQDWLEAHGAAYGLDWLEAHGAANVEAEGGPQRFASDDPDMESSEYSELSIFYAGEGCGKPFIDIQNGDLQVVGSKTECFSNAEIATAKALQLPYDEAPDEFEDTPRPAFPLLVTKDWIEKNTPNIEILWVNPLEVSEDGKHVTRWLEAYNRDQAEGECCHGMSNPLATVEYDFPSANGEQDLFARQRRIDAFAKREMACLRELDGYANAEYRARKVQMKREKCNR